MRPRTNGMGSSVEFNVDRPCIRCRRKAVDVLERGQRHAVLFMFMETGPFAGDRCWKLSAGIRLETSSLRLRGGSSTRDSRTSVTSRLGKEAYEGWMVLGRMCVFVSSSLGDNIVFSFFFFFSLGEYLLWAWMVGFRVDDSFNASFIRCLLPSGWIAWLLKMWLSKMARGMIGNICFRITKMFYFG